MKIIVQSHKVGEKEIYEFSLQDGPNDKEKVKGYANDLVVAFSKIIEWTTRISADYASEGIPDSEADYNGG